MATSPQAWRRPVAYLAAAALVAGIYARLKGLGSAPFSVDEYYLARSVDYVQHSGIPEFPCGGFYMRGVIEQYFAAALVLIGCSAELAPRLVSVLGSLIALPAVFELGRRIHGRTIGLLAVALLALSVWEVEMARFGRMYAPFQAVFLWYMVYFLRYTADREARALLPMIALSVIGPFVWEGGVFLPLANLLALFLIRWPNRMQRRDWAYLASSAILLLWAVWFVTADFRNPAHDAWPPDYADSMNSADTDTLALLKLPVASLLEHPLWAALAAAAALAVANALRRVWTFRARWFLTAGMVAMLVAALIHQFLAVAAIGLLLLLTRLVTWEELFSRKSRPFSGAIALCLIYWLAFGAWTALHSDVTAGVPARFAMLAYQLLRFPDVLEVVVRPWARTVPHLGIGLLVLTAIALYRAARSDATPPYERVLLIGFLTFLLAASASNPPREETRYVFFLYPVAIVVALTVLARAAALFVGNGTPATAITCIAALAGFALSEDFQPRHLAQIDADSELFRTRMTPAMTEHLVIRTDYRVLARWLEQNRSSGDVVINGTHGLDHYYPRFDYFYVEESSPNFPDWACRRGTVERWTDHPLLYSVDALASKVTSSPRVLLTSFSYGLDATLQSLSALHPRVVATSGDVVIIELKG